MARQAATQAKILEGVTTAPTWSSLYQYYGVPHGTDLTPYIQASRTGTPLPSMSGASKIPASPAADTIPEFTSPSSSGKGKAEGGLMSLRKYAKGGTPKATTAAQDKYVTNVAKLKNPLPQQVAKANAIKKQQTAYAKYQADTKDAPQATTEAQAKQATAYGFDPSQKETSPDLYSKYGGLSNVISQEAMDQLRAAGVAPETIAQGAGLMGQGAAGLQGVLKRSWTDPGTAQAYMNPYMQTAMQSQEDLANRQFAQQQNLLRSRAAQSGAFGGSASALAEQAAQQNQNLANQNMVAQGMNQAYQQGMGQFATEQGQGLQGYNQMGGLGQGLGGLGISTWGARQNLVPMWGSAAANVNTLGQNAATAAQQTAINNLTGTAAAYQPVVNLVNSAAGSTLQQNQQRLAGTTG